MLDAAFFLFIALVSPLADLWFYPRLERASAAGVPGVRPRYYLAGAASLWLLAGCAIALAMRRHLPWSDLRLGVPSPLRMAIGAAFVVAWTGLALMQRRALLAKPERLRRVMQIHHKSEALSPHSRHELKVFSLLAVSAGFCEEVVYRGFVIWFVAMWIGLAPAVIVSSILFGSAHLYLGAKHVLRTAIVGLFFAGIAVASASLWPVIVIHALMDLIGGDITLRAVSPAGG
jgi:CAAX protease family protein